MKTGRYQGGGRALTVAKFTKGQSGNPRGRPPGTANQYALRSQIAADLPAIIEVLKDKALDGDTTAARVLLDKSMANLKPQDAPLEVRLNLDTRNPAEAARAVLMAVATGTLTPDEGQALMGNITALARIVETDEILARLTRLEAAACGITAPA